MLHWHELKADIPNLDELLEQHRRHGGFIIQYDRIVSAIIYTRRTATYEWVPDRAARHVAGLRHAGWCALLGWWSWVGLVLTGMFIFFNLLGGLDFTRVLTTPPPLPGATDDPALHELDLIEKRRRYLLLAVLILVFLLIFVAPRF